LETCVVFGAIVILISAGVYSFPCDVSIALFVFGEAIAQRFWVRAMSELTRPYQSSRKLDLVPDMGYFSGPIVPDLTWEGVVE
jgi:hypothetical protein